MNFLNTLKVANTINRQLVREYAFKSDLKIKWNRPEKIPCIRPERSGDAALLPALSNKEIVAEFRGSKELESADEVIKSLFLLENNPRIHTSDVYRDMLIKEVQRHPLDLGSMEAKLAKMTATIRRFQEHMEKFPRDVRIKVMLKEMIDKRKKYLKFLRRWDYKRFEWILEKLDLVYKPSPNEFHWITRKESLQKLTNTHCDDIKETRLSEYRKQLEDQQIPFLEKKIASLEFIRNEQIECKVAVTISSEQINEAKRRLGELQKKAKSAKQESNGYE